jgi:hypothetical protein
MIDWTEDLLTQIEAFSRVALSYPGVDGYPVVLPLPLAFDRDKRCFTLPIPHQRPIPASEEQVSLTLLHYDEYLITRILLSRQERPGEEDFSCSVKGPKKKP